MDVFERKEVWAAAERLPDLDHEALEAKDAVIDAARAAGVVAAETGGVDALRESVLAGGEGTVAEEDADRDGAGVSKAEHPDVTKRWRSCLRHFRFLSGVV